jgi:hypothetical protein
MTIDAATDEQLHPDTCSWDRCVECAAVRRFAAKWNIGQLRQQPTITSTWWQSAEATERYRRGINPTWKESP